MYYTIITINLTHEVQIMNHFIIKDKEEVKKTYETSPFFW